MASVVVLGGCGSSGGDTGEPEPGVGSLVEVAPGPLSSRDGAVVAAVDRTVIVFGGESDLCPPTADCALPNRPPFVDGAAYDVETDMWRAIADAPAGVRDIRAAVVDGVVHAFVQCALSPRCPTGPMTMAYDVGADEWSELAPIPGRGWHEPVGFEGDLFAISVTDEVGEPDYRYDRAKDRWVELPPAPMAAAFDRYGVVVNGSLVLYGSPIKGDDPAKLVARFEPTTGEWVALASAPGAGWQPFAVEDSVVLNPHFPDAAGGIHDPHADQWSPLPPPPDSESWRNDIAGVIGANAARYQESSGWALDLVTEQWIEIAIPDARVVSGESVIAIGRDLFVFGGHYWDDDETLVEGATWLWSPDPSG